jgi:hypothetical protein
MSAWSPEDGQRRAHPELVHLAVLDLQLAMLARVLADIHGEKGSSTTESKDQARSLARVMRALRAQIEAYRQVLELPRAPEPRRFR